MVALLTRLRTNLSPRGDVDATPAPRLMSLR